MTARATLSLAGTLCLSALMGCATTVRRLDGEVTTAAGPARNACERESWLVIAPTHTEQVEPGHKLTTPRNDGIGLYRVGDDAPESIPGLRDELGDPPFVITHAEKVKRHDDKRVLAASLGGAALVALGIGTVLFASSFETQGEGTAQEELHIDTGRAVGGGLVFALGFGLGIAGIVVSPSPSERAEADAWRYAFRPPEDDLKEVKGMVEKHNLDLRKRCGGSSAESAER